MKSHVMVKPKPTSLRSLLSLCGYFGALLALFLISNVALAGAGGGGGEGASLGTIAANITGTMDDVSKLIVAGSYVAGVAFALMGMLKFKAHKDNPTQVPLSQPIVLLAIAAGLVFLPSLISSAGSTVWAGSAQRASSKGEGL